MKKDNLKVIISDQPESPIQKIELIDKKQFQSKFYKDIKRLVKEKQAKFHGRAVNKSNGGIYQIFAIGEKRILVEDLEATEILSTLFDSDKRVREFEVKK